MKRIAVAVTSATMLAGMAHAAVTELVIYKDADFKGATQTVKGEVAHLEDGFARQGVSLVVRGGYWEACSRDHFRGDCRVLAEGQYPRLEPGWHKRIVSVRFLGADPKYAVRGPAARDDAQAAFGFGAVDLYGLADFRGRSVRVHDNVRDLGDRNHDGSAASAIVHAGTWVMCSDPGFHGRCAVLAPGQYPHLPDLEDRVSSLRQVR